MLHTLDRLIQASLQTLGELCSSREAYEGATIDVSNWGGEHCVSKHLHSKLRTIVIAAYHRLASGIRQKQA